MKKLESLNLKKFQNNEISNLTQISGGTLWGTKKSGETTFSDCQDDTTNDIKSGNYTTGGDDNHDKCQGMDMGNDPISVNPLFAESNSSYAGAAFSMEDHSFAYDFHTMG